MPFLLARPRVDDGAWNVSSALAAASAAERTAGNNRSNTRGRVAYLLCEFGYQLARRNAERDDDLPLSRVKIAEALGVSLCRVKRSLALLSLSQVIATYGQSIRVLDWRRLCAVAGYDLSRFGLKDEDYEAALITGEKDRRLQNSLTASGDPACFV